MPPRQFVYLPKTSTNATPILHPRYDFNRTMPDVRLQVGLVRLVDDKPVGLGLRFEMPEGVGVHHYYHCQMTPAFGRRVDISQGLELFDTCPAIPLAATNAIELLAVLLVSLYGGDLFARIGLPAPPRTHGILLRALGAMGVPAQSCPGVDDVHGEFYVTALGTTYRCWDYDGSRTAARKSGGPNLRLQQEIKTCLKARHGKQTKVIFSQNRPAAGTTLTDFLFEPKPVGGRSRRG